MHVKETRHLGLFTNKIHIYYILIVSLLTKLADSGFLDLRYLIVIGLRNFFMFYSLVFLLIIV